MNTDQLRILPPRSDDDRAWLLALWRDEWGGDIMVTRGRTYHVYDLSALIAFAGEERVALATYFVHGDTCELMSLNALARGQGAGSALLTAVEDVARQAGCTRLWLITSNDNLDALKFYQRRGYRLTAVHAGAIDEARKQKPAIPLIGYHGILIHDELELSKHL